MNNQHSNTPYIIEGVLTYIPRVNGVDNYGRHSITIIPDDQSVIQRLQEQREDLLEYRETTHSIPADVRPYNAPWKVIRSHELYGITINWSDKEKYSKETSFVDEKGEPLESKYTDQQLQKARVKCSFDLWSYYFDKDGPKYGTKCKLRKFQVLKTATFDEMVASDHHEATKEPATTDF